jgi:putative flippase GtrA
MVSPYRYHLSVTLNLSRIHIEAFKYGIVGAVALIIDVGIFNLLITSSFWQSFPNPSITAKVVSSCLAISFAFVGHKFWTFRTRIGNNNTRKQLLLFVFVNFVGLLISVSCLFISRNIFGYTSQLADNISANVIGLILGTLFRFLANRRWVFTH